MFPIDKNTLQQIWHESNSFPDAEIMDIVNLHRLELPVTEENIFYTTPAYDSEVEYPLTLKEDQYFILCDNREGAKDSRSFGAVDTSEIKGKVITIVRRSGI